MFKNITLALLCAFCVNFNAKAQFSLDDDSLFTDDFVDTYTDIAVHTFIRNTSTKDTVTIVWNRTLNNIPSGWTSAICDINTCYGPTVSTEEFTLLPKGNPGSVGELSFHFYTGMNNGKGKMIVRFSKKSNPSYYIDVFVNCQAYGLGVSSVKNSNFNIYPNPAVNSITIGSDNIQSGTYEIFNIMGEKVQKASFNGAQTIDVSTLSKGIYLVTIKNENSVATSRLVIE